MRARIHANGLVPLAASVLLSAGCALAPDAGAQPALACPYGYYWVPDYGCVASGYLYGPPDYVYPDYSFGLLYGPYYGWGGGFWGGWYGRGWYGRGLGWGGYGRGWAHGGYGGGWGGFHGGGGWGGGGFHGGGGGHH